jgi:putative endonuclease
MSSYFIYMLRCADNTLYTGITTDIARRLQEHNIGKKWAKYTRMRRPVELIFEEAHTTRSEASKREYSIKQLSRTEKENLIQNHVK